MPHGDRRADVIRRVEGVTRHGRDARSTCASGSATRTPFRGSGSRPRARHGARRRRRTRRDGRPRARARRARTTPTRPRSTVSAGETVDLIAHLVSRRTASRRRRRRRRADRRTRSTGGGLGDRIATAPVEYAGGGAPVACSCCARSPTRTPAASSRPPRRACPSSSAASATGTTATSGCATRRSRSRCYRCTASPSEAEDWRNWLLRAIAGDPADVQIMYGLAGERHLRE